MAERTIVKEVKNCIQYSDSTFLVKNCRWSYPHVLEPYGGTDKEGKPITPSWSIVGVMPKGKDHEAAKNMLRDHINDILKQHKDPKTGAAAMVKADAKFLRDGDQAGKEAYMGCWTVSAREELKRPPKVRDADGRTRLVATNPDDMEKIFGGVWGHILIRPWFQNNVHGKRVNAGLVAVQFIRTDEAYGESVKVNDDQLDETFEDESSAWEGGSGDDLADRAADL